MIFTNKPMFWLEVKVLTPDKEGEVNQRMSTDSLDSVITRLESIIKYLEKYRK